MRNSCYGLIPDTVITYVRTYLSFLASYFTNATNSLIALIQQHLGESEQDS